MKRLVLALVAASLLASSAAAQEAVFKNGWHEDVKSGFKLKIPDKWEQVPVSVDEKWIVAKYLCNREYVARGEWSVSHKPTLRVIVFYDEAKRRKGPKVEKTETEEGVNVSVTGAETPYKDYPDFLKRTLGEGHYVDKDAEGKGAGGLVARQLEVRLDKGSMAKRRIVTWVFRGEDADYAVEYDGLEDHIEKLLPVFRDSLKTFQFIKRAAASSAGGGTTEGSKIDAFGPGGRKKWKEYSAEERTRKRKTDEEARFNKAKKSVPPGWTIKESKNFFIISHADERYTARVSEAAEACRKFLDEHFADLTDEYVMRGVIRIFADYDEYRAYARDLSGWSPSNREILTYKDASMGRRSGFDQLFRFLGNAYLADKDSLFYFSMPTWFDLGLDGVLGAATIKDGKFQPVTDVYEAQLVAESVRDKKVPRAKALLEMSIEQFYADGRGANGAFAARLVRWLLGPGKKDAATKTFVRDYLRAALEVLGEDEPSADAASSRKSVRDAESEEEEERLLKEQKEAGKKRSGESVKRVNDKALAAWTDAQWAALQKGYESTLN